MLFSRQDDYIKISIYDSVSNEFISRQTYWNFELKKEFPICFDEDKPTSILLRKGYPSSVLSYNYINNEISAENCISEGYEDSFMDNFQFVYNPQSRTKGIIGQCLDGFKIYYDSPESVYHQVKKYDVIPTGRQRSYMCAPDFSFIVYYALFHRIFKLSDLPYGCRNEIDVDNGCYISYANGDATTESLCGNDHISIACAMVMHPINNKVFAVMLAGDRIIHYFNSQGIFLAEQKMSISDKGKFDDEVGTAHKYLDFSANGELLAAVFPRNIAIFNVPFHVQYGMKEDKLLLIVQCLKKYQLNGNLLPRDILRLLFNSLKY